MQDDSSPAARQQSDAMASKLYWELGGKDHFCMDYQEKIAAQLDHYMEWYGLEMPDLTLPAIEEAQEVFADGADNLPVTTPEQTVKTASLFSTHQHKWSAAERVVIAANIKTASLHHGVDVDVPFDGSLEVSQFMPRAIEMRKDAMRREMRNLHAEFGDAFDYSICDEYLELMDNIDYNDEPYKIAALIEQADIETGMNAGWGEVYPDPVGTVLRGIGIEKKSQWDGKDFEALRGVFADEIVDQIAENPDVVIPSLPMDEQRIIEGYLNEA